MFTFDGHSVVQALQERQLLNAASSSAERNGSPRVPRFSSTARMAFARPRVDMISSPVAMNLTLVPRAAASIMSPMMLLPLTCSSSFSTKTSDLNRLVTRTIMAAGRAWMPILFCTRSSFTCVAGAVVSLFSIAV